jgi:hypothetical protein
MTPPRLERVRPSAMRSRRDDAALAEQRARDGDAGTLAADAAEPPASSGADRVEKRLASLSSSVYELEGRLERAAWEALALKVDGAAVRRRLRRAGGAPPARGDRAGRPPTVEQPRAPGRAGGAQGEARRHRGGAGRVPGRRSRAGSS